MIISEEAKRGYTYFSWGYKGSCIKVEYPFSAYAAYDEKNNKIVVFKSEESLCLVLDPDGTLSKKFFLLIPTNCRFYNFTKSIVGDFGFTVILGHQPNYKGELFWQHILDIDKEILSGPEAIWR
ncbi:MAG: hypothetical protein VX447_01420 [Pseudomonadota bacterium]|nr:hypothetical protein [Pseudomonadota bacterium]